jgi:TusA-related sulfurtransferase
MALNPETTLQQLTARLNKEAAKAESGSWLEILSGVANITEDIAAIKKTETAEQLAERDQRHAADEAYFAEQRATHAQQADEFYDRKQHLEAVILRKTVLQSNEYVAGQVHFPRTDAAHRLRVVLFINARPVVFDFTQK